MYASKRHAYKRHAPMIAREMHAPVRYTRCEMHGCEASRIDLSMLLFVYWTYFGFGIGAGKITALLAVKSVDAGSTKAYF
jgi:hypothetical protein